MSSFSTNNISDTIKGFPDAWNRFWFQPQSPLPLCVFRIFFGAVMVASFLIQFGRDYLLFYGVNSILPASSIDVYQWHRLPVFDLLLVLPPEDSVRIGFLYFSAFVAFLVMIGFCTRLSTAILFLCYLSLCNHVPIILMAGDNFARLIALFLCFSPCGERLSVDALLKKENGRRLYLPTAQRMIQVQLCIIYLVNVLYKFAGLKWRDGSAVYYATHILDYTRVAIPAFLDVPIVSIVLTFSTLILETLFVFLLWAKNKKLRYSIILIACVFHLGLDYSFSLGVFEWYFIVSLLLFFDPEDLEKLFRLSVHKFSVKTDSSSVKNEVIARQFPLSEQL